MKKSFQYNRNNLNNHYKNNIDRSATTYPSRKNNNYTNRTITSTNNSAEYSILPSEQKAVRVPYTSNNSIHVN